MALMVRPDLLVLMAPMVRPDLLVLMVLPGPRL
jgi:hypothetical protein